MKQKWTEEKIRKELSKSDRWCCNDQPELDWAVEVLMCGDIYGGQSFPIKTLDMESNDVLVIEFTRPLYQDEVLLIQRLSADEPERVEREQTVWRFWWD